MKKRILMFALALLFVNCNSKKAEGKQNHSGQLRLSEVQDRQLAVCAKRQLLCF